MKQICVLVLLAHQGLGQYGPPRKSNAPAVNLPNDQANEIAPPGLLSTNRATNYWWAGANSPFAPGSQPPPCNPGQCANSGSGFHSPPGSYPQPQPGNYPSGQPQPHPGSPSGQHQPQPGAPSGQTQPGQPFLGQPPQGYPSGQLQQPSPQTPGNNNQPPQGGSSSPGINIANNPFLSSALQKPIQSSSSCSSGEYCTSPNSCSDSSPNQGTNCGNGQVCCKNVKPTGPSNPGLKNPSQPQPGFQPPSQPQQGYQPPSPPQSGYQPPNQPQPGYQPPSQSKPGFQQPSQPGFQNPNQPQPGFQNPNQPQPGFQNPSQPQPGFPRPNQPQPGFQNPSQPQPGFQNPNQPQPGFQTPNQPQPGYNNQGNNHNFPLNTEIPKECAAALKCVELSYCTQDGVMSDRPVVLTREQIENRVPLSDCQNPETGIIGKCCRDPNYKDPWPAGMMMNKPGQFGGNQPAPGAPPTSLPGHTINKPLGAFNTQVTPFPPAKPNPFPQPLPNPSQNEIKYPAPSTGFEPPYPSGQSPQQPEPSPVLYPGQAKPQNGFHPQSQPGQPHSQTKPQVHPAFPNQPQPGFQSPNQPQPGFQTPNQPQPGFQNPSQPQPGFQNPSQPQPGYQNPNQPQPGFQNPSPQPGFQNPSQPQPGFQNPSQPQPGFQNPSQPGFHTPNQQQPGFQAPGQQLPSTGYPAQPSTGGNDQKGFPPQDTQACRTRQQPHSNNNDDSTNPGEFPWHVAILSAANRTILCSGSIISDNAVLTSAHCLQGLEGKDVLVKAGPANSNSPAQIRTVAAIVNHPSYDSGSLVKDQAVLALTEPLNLQEDVGKVCLPAEENPQPLQNTGKTCFITGFGRPAPQSPSPSLHKMAVNAVPKNQCENSLKQTFLGKYFILNDGFSCAAPNGGGTFCTVDIGSGLVCDRGDGQYELVGVYSWDTSCQTSAPAVISDCDAPWINQVLGTPVNVLQENAAKARPETMRPEDIDSKPGFALGYGK